MSKIEYIRSELVYECPVHKGVKYTRPGKCRITLITKYCVLCGEVNPEEIHAMHNKPGCGGYVATKREVCGLQLIPSEGVQ